MIEQTEVASIPAAWIVVMHKLRGNHRMKKRGKLETNTPPIGDRLLTLREAADVLCLSTRTACEYVGRGEIEGRIIGGRWRLRRADLDAFFANAPRNRDFAGKNGDGD